MKTEYIIHQIQTGYQVLDRGLYATFRKGLGSVMEHPVFAFLLEGGGKKILVDTGMSDTAHSVKFHHNGRQDSGQAVHEQLASLNVAIDEIDAIIFTHLHWDHCYNLEKFEKSDLYASRLEYDFAMNPIPPYWTSYEHPKAGLNAPFRNRYFNLIDGEAELFDGIDIFPIPGHSPGHIAVSVNTAKGNFVIVGDLMFVRENFEEYTEHQWPLTPPGRFCSFVDIWESMERAIMRSDYVLMTHDPQQMKFSSFPCDGDDEMKVPEDAKRRVKERMEQ